MGYHEDRLEWKDMTVREKLLLKIQNDGCCLSMDCDSCPLEGQCDNPCHDLVLAKKMLKELDEKKKREMENLAKSEETLPPLEIVDVDEFLQELREDATTLLEKIKILEARLANK